MKATIEKQKDGEFIAYNTNPEEITIIGTGATVREAKIDFANTIEEVKSTYSPDDKIPEYLTESVSFTFDIVSLFEYYDMINVSALARHLGINPGLMRQYRSGHAPISEKQLLKIQNGINALGNELADLCLV